MESAREALDKNLCVDTMTDNIWHGMNEAMHKAALEHFIVGEKEEHKEMKELKTERREMLSRRWELRQKVIEKENNNEHEMEMNELEEAQFRLSTICLKMKKMYKAERKLKEKRWEEELAIAWSNYNVSKSWRVTRRIARSQKGVKKRGYATTCMPTKEEWITHLSRPGPEGGLEATIVDFEAEKKRVLQQDGIPLSGHVTDRIRELALEDENGIA